MNNTFRPVYRSLSSEEHENLLTLKRQATDLEDAIKGFMPPGRHQSLALTKLEEAVMWAVKGITE